MATQTHIDPRRREPQRRREPEAAPTPEHQLLALQRTLGNQAVARMLAARTPRQPTVARAITVNGERFTHGSRRVVDLFENTVVPILDMNNFKTYGVKSKLVEFIRITDADYDDETEFIEAFFPWLQQQTRNVRGGNTTPVLKQFSVQSMSRPAWPTALKQLKGVLAGDNVRHVVRNATLKRALDVAWDKAGAMGRKGVLTQLAADLAVPVNAADTDAALMQRIYNTLYLHPDNLFAGGGPRNQIIGFAADPVRQIGEALVDQDGDADVNQVYGEVRDAIAVAAARVRVDANQRAAILGEIDTIVQDAFRSLTQNGTTTVPYEVVGDLVMDFGLGFGFDLIDGRVADDINGIARRQGRLFFAEQALGSYINTGGQGDLTFAFRVFLGMADPPNQ